MKILMLFFDGLGLGKEIESNPLSKETLIFNHLLEGKTLTIGTAPYYGRRCTLLAASSSLGWPGLPQSATGQTALFTGINPMPLVKEHQSGLPGPVLRDILGEKGIFIQLKERGLKGTFANAYGPSFFKRLERGGEDSFSATTVMVYRAGLPFRSFGELRKGEALYCDMDHSILQEMGYDSLPLLSPFEAGRRLANLATQYDFTLFESFLTDRIGHSQDENRGKKMVERLDLFLRGILSLLDLESTLLLLTSDHGNFEDLSIATHTYHPVPVLLIGFGRERVAEKIHGIETITPALLDLYE